MHDRALFSIEDLGAFAESGLVAARTGRVAAVFARSFYLVTDRGAWACIGPQALGAGPLNVRYCGCLVGPPCQGASVRFGDGAVAVEDVGGFVYREARRWTPPEPPGWTLSTLRQGIEALEAVANPPAEGLGRLGFGATPAIGDGPVLQRGAAAAAALDGAIRALLSNEQPQGLELVEQLIGLGPGLTPSGDDYLGGAMVALALIGERPARDALWETISRRMETLTSAVSQAHLRAAAAGAGAHSLHVLLNSVLAGQKDRLPERIAAVDAVGHTSGWDALAGALRVLRVWLSARNPVLLLRG